MKKKPRLMRRLMPMKKEQLMQMKKEQLMRRLMPTPDWSWMTGCLEDVTVARRTELMTRN